VRKFLFSAGYIKDALHSYELSLKSTDFYCTIGVHPCRAREPFIEYEKTLSEGTEEAKETQSPDEVIAKYFKEIDEILEKSARKDKFVAIGECGLDYDRFEYADKET
jgi:TatD DNase family protein